MDGQQQQQQQAQVQDEQRKLLEEVAQLLRNGLISQEEASSSRAAILGQTPSHEKPNFPAYDDDDVDDGAPLLRNASSSQHIPLQKFPPSKPASAPQHQQPLPVPQQQQQGFFQFPQQQHFHAPPPPNPYHAPQQLQPFHPPPPQYLQPQHFHVPQQNFQVPQPPQQAPFPVPQQQQAMPPQYPPALSNQGLAQHNLFLAARATVPQYFQESFYSLCSLEGHCYNLAVAASFFLFPVGLVSLAGILPRVSAPSVVKVNFILFLISLGAMIPFFILGSSRFCIENVCYSTTFMLIFALFFLPTLIITVIAMFLGWKADTLEVKLLQENPHWFLIMRNDPSALRNQLDHFEIQFKKLLASEHQMRVQCILSSVFLFPIGLLTLAGFGIHGTRPTFVKVLSIFLVVVYSGLTIFLGIFGAYPMFYVSLPPIIIMVFLLMTSIRVERLQHILKQMDHNRYESYIRSTTKPAEISACNF